MIKKNVIVLAVLLILSVVCAIAVLNIKPDSLNKQVNDVKVTPTPEILSSETGKAAIQSETENKIGNIRIEGIPVLHNSPDIGLKAILCEDSLKETNIKLEFKNADLDVKKELDSSKIPELYQMFEKRDAVAGIRKGNTIRNIYLNALYGKAYIMVEGNPGEQGVDTAVYVYNLKDFSLMKLSAEVGCFTDMAFSGDKKYIVFSYFNGSNSNNSFLQVVNCQTDKFKVNKNKYENNVYMGNYNGKRCFYVFVNWHENNILELMEASYTLGIDGIVPESRKQSEVLYDLEKNVFMNTDGTVVGLKKETVKTEVKPTVLESGPVSTIKMFYGYLPEGQYTKAYDLLDDTFRFNAFKGLGMQGFKKSNISPNEFAAYGSILKMTKFDSVVLEKTDVNTSKVYFYIILSSGKGIEIKQPLVVELKKVNKSWKIVSVEDGNTKNPPFKQ